MKILIVTDAWHPQLNGVVRTYEYISRELTDMGYDVRIIGPDSLPYSIPMPGYPEIRLALFPYNVIRQGIEDYAPDVLHIATEGPLGLAARKYAVEYGVEFTSCFHTHFPDYAQKRVPAWLGFLKSPVREAGIKFVRWFHAVSSCVFVATPSLENTLKGWGFKVPVKRMTRGVDLSVFYPGEKNLFHSLPRPIALYVGRVAIEKNLEAFLGMDWAGSKVVVGSGPDLDPLREKYPKVVFAGVKTGKDLADCYRSSDLFVFPSKTDTFGMVIIEALACGLPVAGYPVTGPIDIITEKTLGAVDDDLSRAAQNALRHGTAQERHDYVARQYSWRKTAEQFLETD